MQHSYHSVDRMNLVLPKYIYQFVLDNAHMFYIKTKNLIERTELINFLKQKEIMAVFHYIPLHTAPAGLKYGHFFNEDKYTTKIVIWSFINSILNFLNNIGNCIF